MSTRPGDITRSPSRRLPSAGEDAGACPSPFLRTLSDIACTMCGCVCDDLNITVDSERVLAFSPPCHLAESWLLTQSTASDVAQARVDGRATDVPTAINRAAQILHGAVSPLVYGLSRSSTPGQRSAVRLADRIGACIDTTASTCHAPSIMALQVVGESTATLGEVRNRSDLVVYWGSNPLDSHPRHLERVVEPPGALASGGRAARQLIVVDTQRTDTAHIADRFVRVAPGGDFELIWALRAHVRGMPVEDPMVAGVTREELRELAEALMSCRYGAIFFGLGLTRHGVSHASVEALLRLVTDLNAHTRVVARRMRIPGDVAGADTVLCWQTGFPFSVNLTRGYARYNPGEYTANVLLERGEVDAALLVGSEGVTKLSLPARRYLEQIPVIVLDYPGVTTPIPTAVQFTTAVYGIHRPGTAYRMDEVPVPLRPVLDSPLPADHEILEGILQRLTTTPA